MNPILVTDSGITMARNAVQQPKATGPISVIERGMETDVMLQHPEKQYSPSLRTDSGIKVEFPPLTSVLVDVSMIALQLLRES